MALTALTGRKLAGVTQLLLASLLALAAWGLLVVLATRPDLKTLWDLSPQARFTVEPATAELLGQLRAEGKSVEFHTILVPLHTIRTDSVEARKYRALQEQLQGLTVDLLRQYAYLGGDAVKVEHHDLLRNPARIKEVVREVGERHTNSVILKVGKRSKVLSLEADLAEIDVPRLSAPQGLGGSARQGLPTLKDYKGEEAISTALKQLLVEGTPKVYFLGGDSRMSLEAIGPSHSGLLHTLEQDGFEIAFLNLDEDRRVPDDAAVVALVDPHRELTEPSAELLFQWVRRGGRLLVALSYVDEPIEWNVPLRSLGERFGFEIGPELVCHVLPDPNNPAQAMTGNAMCQNLTAVGLNPTHPVTRPLALRERWPQLKAGREIRAVSGREGIRVDTSFLRTGPGAWLQPRPIGQFVGPPTREAYASRCIGAVIDVDAAETGQRTGHAVVIAAEAFDNLTLQFNGDLALNLFNWLTEREALISIRGSKYVPTLFEVKPQQLERVFWLLVAGVPGVLAMLGLVVFWRRSRS